MDLLNKYIFFTLLFIFPHYFYSQGCSVDRSAFLNKTLAETFYKNEQTIKIVFSCKVINSTVTATGSAYSIAEIKDVFFGKTNLKQIKISSGYFVPPPPPKPPPLLIPPPKPIKKTNYNVPYIDDDEILIDQDYRGSTNWGIKMMKDSIYIIYSTNDTAFVRSYLEFSKQLKETSAIRNEIEILKKFDGIFKNKMSGHFIFKDEKGNILANGSYKKGKLSGVWKNYDAKGNLLSWEDFKEDKYTSYYLNGNLKEKIVQYKDSTVVENYANSSKLQFTTKIITPKNDTAANVIIYEYDKNGFIMAKHGERAYLNNGLYWEYYPNGKVKTISEYKRQFQNFRLGIYQEYYPSGKLKLDAHIYKARRVGCWTWYYEDGTFWAEWDYFDGKAPQ